MQKKNFIVVDIETVPDVISAKNLSQNMSNINEDYSYIKEIKVDSLKDAKSFLDGYHLNTTDGRNSFHRQPFHKIVCISYARCSMVQDGLDCYIDLEDIGTSSGWKEKDEKSSLSSFSNYINTKLESVPHIVTFNGRNFDIPVLKYRSMLYGIGLSKLYSQNFCYRFNLSNNLDLIEAFSNYGSSSNVKMLELCAMLGIPIKLDGIDGSSVFDLYEQNKISEIVKYCETDVIATLFLLIYYARSSCSLFGIEIKNSNKFFDLCMDFVKNYLEKSSKSHKQYWKNYCNMQSEIFKSSKSKEN